MSVADYLERTTIADLLEMRGESNQQVVTVDAKEHFHTALWKLLTKKVSSAPVFDKEGGKFTAMVDLLDLLTYALIEFEENALLASGSQREWTGGALDDKVHCISDMSLRNPYLAVTPEQPLTALLELFGQHTGVHRVPVVNSGSGKVVSIVSQSDVVLLAATAWTKFALGGVIGDWALKKVHQVHHKAKVSKAFELIIDSGITALPIIDDEGRILGTLSATDLKGVPPGHIFKYLSLTVGEFKDRARTPQRAQITCSVGDNLADVFNKLVANRVHRLWVLQEAKLVGVVTLTDLCAKFAETAQLGTELL